MNFDFDAERHMDMLQGNLSPAEPGSDVMDGNNYDKEQVQKPLEETPCPSGPPIDHYQPSGRRLNKVRVGSATCVQELATEPKMLYGATDADLRCWYSLSSHRHRQVVELAAKPQVQTVTICPANSLTLPQKELLDRLSYANQKAWSSVRKRSMVPLPLPAATERRMRQWFELVDGDGSGHLNASEVEFALKASGINASATTVAEVIKLVSGGVICNMWCACAGGNRVCRSAFRSLYY
ncbi:hypothetical protein Vretifemale_3731 [Volvox reticuliferus]|nr:hypothetical protein Vretifemale_3731 [Volvox reticuliferus]